MFKINFKSILTVLLLSFTFFFLQNKSKAFAFFEENFNSLDTNIWNTYNNEGSATINTGILLLKSPIAKSYPYLNPKPEKFILPEDNFSIETKFKFEGNYSFGYGINLTDSLLNNQTPNDLQWGDLIILAWPSGGGNFSIFSAVCPKEQTNCNDNYNKSIFTDTTGSWHKLKVKYSSGIYEIYVDDLLKLESKISTKKISTIWLGNPQKTNQDQNWGDLHIDYIKVESLNSEPAPNTPIIIIPGMGASWDYKAILTGTSGNNWQIPSFVPIYDNLIDSLKNTGYTEGTDLFVFPYDWRKGLTDLGNDLDNFINNLIIDGKIDSNQKINLITHSMGGLVARSFAEDNYNQINKIITAGTPHMGAVNAYPAWEGATLYNKPWWMRTPFELIIQINRQPKETEVGVVRRLMPSFLNLLPIFDYIEKNSSNIPWNSLSQVNPILNSWDKNTVDPFLHALAGRGVNTKETLKTEDRSWADRVMGRWEDGKPISDTTVEGDGTTTLQSALKDFSNTQEIDNTNHDQIISSKDALEKIFEQLGLDKTKITTNTNINPSQKVFIASLRSPGKIQVCNQNNVCDNNLGILIEDQDLFFLPEYNGEELIVSVKEDGTGDYHLYLGRLDEDKSQWQKLFGNISEPDEIDNFIVKDNQGNMSVKDMQIKILKGPQLINSYYSLMRKIRIDYRNNNWQSLEDDLDKWEELDRMGSLYGKIQLSYVKRMTRYLEYYKNRISKQLSDSNSYYAGVLFEMGEKNLESAKTIETLNSAQYLFQLAGLLK